MSWRLRLPFFRPGGSRSGGGAGFHCVRALTTGDSTPPGMKIHFRRHTNHHGFDVPPRGQRTSVIAGVRLVSGASRESVERNCCFPFDPAGIDAAILSHAHIDHCGNFPNLHRQGFRGIYTAPLPPGTWRPSCWRTRPTSRFRTRSSSTSSGARRGLPPVEPLYSGADAERAVRQSSPWDTTGPCPSCPG